MPRRLTQDEFIERARSVHGDKYDYSKVEYKGKEQKVLIICPEHGEFWQESNSHMRGSGCPVCGSLKRVASRPDTRKTTEWFVEKARQVHGSKYDYSKTRYVDWKTKVCITCPFHGDFYVRPGHHFEGQGCSYCTSRHVHLSEFLTRAREVHSDYYDYSRVSFNNVSDKVCIICPEHGEFYQRVSSHLSGDGCPVCAHTKRANTCMVRYGVAYPCASDESRAKGLATVRKRYGVDNVFSADLVRCKIKQVNLAKYGVENPMQALDIRKRAYATKRLNGSFSTSKPAVVMYDMLCGIFGIDDVHFEYDLDERYPYHCDFYIRSRDMFIELNAFVSHGGRWFDCNSFDDLAKLDALRNKSLISGFYADYVHTWSYRDVLKRNMAREHKLNYLTFWRSDLSDFKEWVVAGCPDGQDWVKEYSWREQA